MVVRTSSWAVLSKVRAWRLVCHIFCVDSSEGRRMIIDNEEQFPITLTVVNDRLCRYPSQNVIIAEVTEFVEKME